MSTEVVTIALVVIVPAIVLWAIFLARTGGFAGRRRPRVGIPAAMRPGEPDETLEGPRLERIQAWGLLATLATAVFIPFYWLPEQQRQEAFQERFDEEALERGELIFAVAPPLPEEADPIEFRQVEQEIALGMGCANCHGGDASGGFVPGGFTDPVTGEITQYRAPPLDNVFTRWDEEVIRFTIERGRPGTPMPAWSVEFGGPMTEQMVSDVIAWLKSLPGNNQPPEGISAACEDPAPDDAACGQEIFEARCAVCHGPQGQGKEEEGLALNRIASMLEDLTGEEVDPQELDLNSLGQPPPTGFGDAGQEVLNQIGTLYTGMALWQGDVTHLSEEQHEITIRNGRRFAFMPQHAEAPAQGIPVPPYPLTDAQIEAVMTYERSL